MLCVVYRCVFCVVYLHLVRVGVPCGRVVAVSVCVRCVRVWCVYDVLCVSGGLRMSSVLSVLDVLYVLHELAVSSVSSAPSVLQCYRCFQCGMH